MEFLHLDQETRRCQHPRSPRNVKYSDFHQDTLDLPFQKIRKMNFTLCILLYLVSFVVFYPSLFLVLLKRHTEILVVDFFLNDGSFIPRCFQALYSVILQLLKSQMKASYLLTLGWPGDLLRLTECSRSDAMPVLQLGFKKPYMLALSASVHVSPSQSLCASQSFATAT